MLQLNLYIVIAGLSLANSLKYEVETNWQAYCNRKRQSPIDVVNDNTVNETDWEQRLRFSGYSKPLTWKIKNSGSHIKVKSFGKNEEEKIMLRGGGLEGSYYAVSINVFWEKGSLHSLAGQFYSMEWQILHIKKDYQSMHEALTKEDGIAVLTFFADVSDINDGPLEEFSRQIETIKDYKELTDLPKNFSLSTLVNAVNPYQFYSYFGSITTPPCHESIYYMVFPKIIPISRKSFSYFKAILDFIHPNSKTAVRSLQKLNNRKIYFYNIMQPKNDTENTTSTEPFIGTHPLSQQEQSVDIKDGAGMKTKFKNSNKAIGSFPDKESKIEFRGISSAEAESNVKEVNANIDKRPISVPYLPGSSTNGAFLGSSTNALYGKSDVYPRSIGPALSAHQNNDISILTNSATSLIRDGSKPYGAIFSSSTIAPFGKSDDHPSSPGSAPSPHQSKAISPVTRSVTPLIRDESKPYGALLGSGTNIPFVKSDDHTSSPGSALSPNQNNDMPSATSSATPLIRDGSKPYSAPLGSNTNAPFDNSDIHLSSPGYAVSRHQTNDIPPVTSTTIPLIRDGIQTYGAPLGSSTNASFVKSDGYPSSTGSALSPHQINVIPTVTSSATPLIIDDRFISIPEATQTHDRSLDQVAISSQLKPQIFHSNKINDNIDRGAFLSSPRTPFDKNAQLSSTPWHIQPNRQRHGNTSGPSLITSYNKSDRYIATPGSILRFDLPQSSRSIAKSYSPLDDNNGYLSKPGVALPQNIVNDYSSWPNALPDTNVQDPSVAGTTLPHGQLYGHTSKASTSAPYGKRERYPSVSEDSISISNNSPFERNYGSSSKPAASPPANKVSNYPSKRSSYTMKNKEKRNPSMSEHSIVDDRGHRYPYALPFRQPSYSTSTPFKQSNGYETQPETAQPVNKVNSFPSTPSLYNTNNKEKSLNTVSDKVHDKKSHEYPSKTGSTTPHDKPFVGSTSTLPGIYLRYTSGEAVARPSVSSSITVPPASSPPANSVTNSSLKRVSLSHDKVDDHSSLLTPNGPHDQNPEYPPLHVTKLRHGQRSVVKSRKSPGTRDQNTSGRPFSRPSNPNSSPLDISGEHQSAQRASTTSNKFGYITKNNDDKFLRKTGNFLPYEQRSGQPLFPITSTQYGAGNRYTFDRPSIRTHSPLDNSDGSQSVSGAFLPPKKVKDQLSWPSSKTPDDEEGESDEYPSIADFTNDNDDKPFVRSTSTLNGPKHRNPSSLPVKRPSMSPTSLLNNSYNYPSVQGVFIPPRKVKSQPSWPNSEKPNDEYPSVADSSISTSYDNSDDYPSKPRAHNKVQVHPTNLLKAESNLPYGQASVKRRLTPYGTDGHYRSEVPFERPPISDSPPRGTSDGYPFKQRATERPYRFKDHSSSPSYFSPLGDDYGHHLKHEPLSSYDQPLVVRTSIPPGKRIRNPSASPSISTSSPRDNSQGYASMQGAPKRPNRFTHRSSSPSYYTPLDEDYAYSPKHEPRLSYDQTSVVKTSIPHGNRNPSGLQFDSTSTSSPLDRSDDYPLQLSVQGDFIPPKKVDDNPSWSSSEASHDTDDESPSTHANLPYGPTSSESKPIQYNTDIHYTYNLRFDPNSISITLKLDNSDGYPSLPGVSLPPNKIDQIDRSLPSSHKIQDEDDDYLSIPESTLPSDQSSVVRISDRPGTADRNPSGLIFGRPSSSPPFNQSDVHQYVPRNSLSRNKVGDRNLTSSYVPHLEDDTFLSRTGNSLPYKQQYRQPSRIDISTQYNKDGRYLSNLAFERSSSPFDDNESYTSVAGHSPPPNKVNNHPSTPFYSTQYYDNYEYQSMPRSTSPYDKLYSQPSFASGSSTPVS